MRGRQGDNTFLPDYVSKTRTHARTHTCTHHSKQCLRYQLCLLGQVTLVINGKIHDCIFCVGLFEINLIVIITLLTHSFIASLDI